MTIANKQEYYKDTNERQPMYETQYIDQQDQYEQIAAQEEYRELMAEKKLTARFQIESDDE